MLIKNATLATMASDGEYGLMTEAALGIDSGKITWIGTNREIPVELTTDPEVVNCNGMLITPGLIDCHTHLVYAGDRASEFELRLQGASYEAISRAGGGIVSTVNATRAASLDGLINQSRPRLQQLMSEGVTTVEIKSGYGLNAEDEIKMLKAAQALATSAGVGLQKTFLGAHALPAEYADRKDAYIDLVCEQMLPAAVEANVADAVDAFSEGIAFSVAQVRKVFEAAKEFNLPIKLHAEQLSDLGGAKMAAQMGALSVDHLEYLAVEDVSVLADAGTVAVLLPGAFYFLKETKLPPIQALRDNQVDIAIASDCNPGSSPVTSLLLSMNMACTLFAMTPAEALRGATINAAKALGLDQNIGSLELGKQADLVLWNTQNPATLSYNIGLNPCLRVMINGEWHNTKNN